VLRRPSLQGVIVRFLQSRLIDAANGNVNANVRCYVVVAFLTDSNFFITVGQIHSSYHVRECVNTSLLHKAAQLNHLISAFDLRSVFAQGRHMHLSLISRRSRFRAGTRYFRRGIDHEGHVANFNETEQILLVEGQTIPGVHRPSGSTFTAKLSFVQIRGSIPIYWAEVNTLRYKPDLQIMDLQDTVRTQSHILCKYINFRIRLMQCKDIFRNKFQYMGSKL
jgi:hypothetical protein